MADLYVVVSIFDSKTAKGDPKQVINVWQCVDKKAAERSKRALEKRFRDDYGINNFEDKLKVVVRKAHPVGYAEDPS